MQRYDFANRCKFESLQSRNPDIRQTITQAVP